MSNFNPLLSPSRLLAHTRRTHKTHENGWRKTKWNEKKRAAINLKFVHSRRVFFPEKHGKLFLKLFYFPSNNASSLIRWVDCLIRCSRERDLCVFLYLAKKKVWVRLFHSSMVINSWTNEDYFFLQKKVSNCFSANEHVCEMSFECPVGVGFYLLKLRPNRSNVNFKLSLQASIHTCLHSFRVCYQAGLIKWHQNSQYQ